MARLPARIRVNATFPFPSLVQANGPVQIAKAGGIWTVSLDPAFVAGGGSNPHLIVGSTHIDGGAANNFLFDNGGILGEVPAGSVTPGSYTNTNLTVTAQGVITSIANGSGGGGGAVSSVSNADGTLIISPTTGAVVASARVATSALTGIVKPDNSTITIGVGGVISASGSSGTVSGSVVVGTIANLAALAAPSSAAAVTVTDLLRGGLFLWSPGDHSVDVTNDPGQGIWVAPTPPGTGLGGAWKRFYDTWVNFTWWGAAPDGVTTDPMGAMTGSSTIVSGTDNSVAFGRFGVWAVHQSSIGKAVCVAPTPGQYNWDGSNVSGGANGYSWLVGIKKFVFEAYGVVMQNIHDAAGNPGDPFGQIFPLSNATLPNSYRINDTTPGNLVFTFTNPADVAASGIAAGMIVALGSFDNQYSSGQPNPQNWEYLAVKAINTPSPGDITTSQSIRYSHMSTYPSYVINPGGPGGAGAPQAYDGRAAVYLLGPNFDIEWTILGLTCNMPPHPNPAQKYFSLSGKKWHTIDYSGPGFAEVFTANVVHDTPRLFTSGELDKSNQTITHNNPQMLEFSTSVQSVAGAGEWIVDGGTLGGVVGLAKKTSMRGVRIGGALQLNSQYGMSTSAVFDSCEVIANTGYGTLFDGSIVPPNPGTTSPNINGTSVKYGDGTSAGAGKIIIDTASFTGASLSNMFQWATIPGMYVNLEANVGGSSLFSNRLGTGIVKAMTFDPPFTTSGSGPTMRTEGKLTIHTTLSFITLPTWASGNIRMFHVNEVIARNCTGSDLIRSMSAAAAAGRRYFEYWEAEWFGIPPNFSQTYNPLPGGAYITEFDIDVIQPTNTGLVNIDISLANDATFTPSQQLEIRIDWSVKGKRTFSTAGVTVLTGGDSITLAGSPITQLPSNMLVVSNMNTAPLFAVPTADFVIQFKMFGDCGLIRRLPNPYFDSINTVISPLQGRYQ